jgi:hypothetical protein
VAHFDDLTPYVYVGGDPDPAVLNVGWLSSSHLFSKGTPVRDFVAALRKLISEPVNLYRGRHYCEFCPPPQFSRSATLMVSTVARDCPWGNGEIWVNGDNDLVYVAPTLILHYVEEHDYEPPDVFVRAVRRH